MLVSVLRRQNFSLLFEDFSNAAGSCETSDCIQITSSALLADFPNTATSQTFGGASDSVIITE